MIIEKAQELGLALSESTEFCRMMEAKAAMDQNESIQEMMREYTELQNGLVGLMEGGEVEKSDMLDLSRQLDEIQANLVAEPVFQEMMEAQHGFQALMQQVNRTIAACIGLDDSQAEGASDHGGCGGGCASCAGCKH